MRGEAFLFSAEQKIRSPQESVLSAKQKTRSRNAAVAFWTLFFFFIAGLALLPRSTAYAAGEFRTSYNTLYTVADDGNVKVTQNVAIENLTSQYFVSQYKFTIGSEDLTSVIAWDSTGSLTPQIKKEGGETKITLNFRARVMGKGNRLHFGISYNFPDLAKKNGLIWELNLLKTSGLEGISSYQLTVSVPESFGHPIFQFPTPVSQRVTNQRRIVVYNKNALLKGAPRMGFGNFQLYQLALTYHLKNPRVGFGYTEVALPPDIPGYQKIIQKSLLPAPRSIRVDGDGNYLARYDLRPLEKKEVVWEGWMVLSYPPRSFGNEKESSLPKDLVQKYTLAQKYWETGSVEIRAEAAKLVDPQLSVAENARRIYDFVTGKLSYDYKKLESGELVRLGAFTALSQTDKAVCMEYTDLLITLARAGGIPAREVNGYAYTIDKTNRPLSLRIEGGDVLHAWPQVYLPKTGWTMVDPTWGSTSGSNYFAAFDLSHLAFVIKGGSSEYPLPAGSYKTDPGQKDVNISFSSETSVRDDSPDLELKVEFPLFAVSPFPLKAAISVTNQGRASAFGTNISLESDVLSLDQATLDIGTVPPGATVTRTVTLSPKSAFTRGEEHLSMVANAKEFNGEPLSFEGSARKIIRPIYLPLDWPSLGVLALTIGLTIWGRKRLLSALSREK